MLKEPSMNESLEQEMAALQSLRVLELKELLSAQTSFNVDISQVAPQDMRVSYFGLKSSGSICLTM